MKPCKVSNLKAYLFSGKHLVSLVFFLSCVCCKTGFAQQPSPYLFERSHKFVSGHIYSNTGNSIKRSAGKLTDRMARRNTVLSSEPSQHSVVAGSLTLTVNYTGTTCGYSNGSFSVSASGGTAPYLYSENGYPFQSSGDYTQKAPGVYTITASDVNGLTGTATITLTNTYSPPTLSIPAYTAPSGCTSLDGSVSLLASGGTAPYEYSMDGVHYQVSNVFSNLSSGDYYFTVRDANGCVAPAQIPFAYVCSLGFGYDYSSEYCYANTAEIDILHPFGGTAPYQYSMDGVNFQNDPDFTGLNAGIYHVYVRDATDKESLFAFTIEQWCSLTITAMTADATCGINDGSINVSAGNGISPYSYSIDGTHFQNSPVFSGLAAGIYTIDILDANGATGQVTATVYSGCPIVTPAIVNAVCGLSNGSLHANGSGGTAPYQYSINGLPYQMNPDFTGLAAGSYILTIKDANGNLGSTAFQILNVCVTANVVVTNSTCGNHNGSILLTGSGGAPPYQFSIDGTLFQTIDLFPGLAAGDYRITVKDANGLVNHIPVTVNNQAAPLLTISASAASCINNDGEIEVSTTGGQSPFLFSISSAFQDSPDFSGLPAGGYTVSVKDANGCQSSKATIIPLKNTLLLQTGKDLTLCEGSSATLSAVTNASSFLWSPRENLVNAQSLTPSANPSTTTKYYLTGSLGVCTAVDSMMVFVNSAPAADAGNDEAICYGKDTSLYGKGGLEYNWSPSTWLSDPNVQNPVVAHPDRTTTYSLVVTDGNGCQSILPARVTVTVIPAARLSAGNDTSIALGEPLSLRAVDLNQSGFNGYSWSPATGLSDPGIANPVAIIDKSITYSVSATTPDGCQADAQITIKVYSHADIYVPNAFSPNGDGHNDLLKALPVGIREFDHFIIFNRWGQEIFHTSNPGIGWDGKINGQFQGSGVFVWMAEGSDYEGKKIVRKGTVILLR